MKKLTLFLILAISTQLFTSCSDDDDPKYKWQTKWTQTYKDINDETVLLENLIFSGIQTDSENTVRASVNSSASIFVLSLPTIVSDEIKDEKDFKSRLIICKVPKSFYPREDYPYDYYIYEVRLTYEKIN